MKKLLIITVLLFSAYTYAESDNSKVDLVEKLMVEYELISTLSLYSTAYTTEVKRVYKHLPSSFWESKEYTKAINDYEKSMWDGWRQAYIDYLNEEELRELITFVESRTNKTPTLETTKNSSLSSPLALSSHILVN